MYISMGTLSSVALEPNHRKSEIYNIVKEAIKSKQIEMGGQKLSVLLFEAFTYFQCFRILANALNFCQTLFDKFHVRLTTGEYPRGSMFHQQRHRPSGCKIQNYHC